MTFQSLNAKRPRSLALKEQDEVNQQISEWINDRIIHVRHSVYYSPLALVRKKDGSASIYVDYQAY